MGLPQSLHIQHSLQTHDATGTYPAFEQVVCPAAGARNGMRNSKRKRCLQMSNGTPQQEIPTHLEVEDRILFGLTLRQGIIALVGLSLGYALYAQLGQFPWFASAGIGAGAGAGAAHPPLPLRIVVGSVPVVVALALAIIQPAGRPLEEWLFALARYAALPKRCVWRPRSNIMASTANDPATAESNDRGGNRSTSHGQVPQASQSTPCGSVNQGMPPQYIQLTTSERRADAEQLVVAREAQAQEVEEP